MTYCVNVRTLLSNDTTHLAQLCHNCHTRSKAIHAIEFCVGAIHHTVLIHDDNKRNIVAKSHFKVIWVVRRGDFNRAGTKVRINKFIGNDWNHAINQREHDLGANHVFIARIIWVHSHCAIAHHCFSTSSCNDDALLAIAVAN